MKKIYILFILSLCDPFAFGQQSAMLEKYRSMALEYSHDLKAAEKIWLPALNWRNPPVQT